MFCSNKNCSPRSVGLFLLVAAVVLWIIWFGASSFFGKKEVENSLNRLSVELSDLGKQYGKNITLSYGDIKIEGWGYNKQAVVSNVSITVAEPMDLAKFVLSTDSISASLDPIDYQRIIIKMAGPVNLAKDNTVVNSLVFTEPLVYAYKEQGSGSDKGFYNDLILPSQVSVVKSESTDGALSSMQEMVISFEKSPTIQFYSASQNSSDLSYGFSGFAVSYGANKLITIGGLSSKAVKFIGESEEGAVHSKNTLQANDIVVYIGGVPTSPYSLKMDAEMVSDKNFESANYSQENMGNSPVNSNEVVGKRDVTLNEYVLSNPNFNVSVTGKFTNMVGDPLPSGELAVNIDNLSKLLSSELVTVLNAGGIEKSFAKITGQPTAEQTAVSFAIKREKGGTLHVGKTTFEELVASVFSGSLLPSSPVRERLPDYTVPANPVSEDFNIPASPEANQ